MQKSELTAFRADTRLIQKTKDLARLQRRSFSDVVREALSKWLEEQNSEELLKEFKREFELA